MPLNRNHITDRLLSCISHLASQGLAHDGVLVTASRARNLCLFGKLLNHRWLLSLKLARAWMVSAAVMLLVFVATAMPQSTQPLGRYRELTLKLISPKHEFVELEPIQMNVVLSNETARPILGHTAICFACDLLELFVIDQDGFKRKVDRLSLLHKFLMVKPRTLDPGARYSSKELLVLDLPSLFPQPGAYQLEAVLHDFERKEEVRSQPLGLQIVEPATGPDRRAVEYLKISGRFAHLFESSGGADPRQAQDNLRHFVMQHSGSVYARYASLSLGKWYFYNGDYNEARYELQKIAESTEFALADEALYYLVQASNRAGLADEVARYMERLRIRHPQSPYLDKVQEILSQAASPR